MAFCLRNMELLLNLAWVLLALPAYWLWRRGDDARSRRGINSLQSLLALGCALVLLFPVISATDDLHAMRAEMEDSSISKRAVRQAASDKGSARIHWLQSPPATVTSTGWLAAPEVGRFEVSIVHLSPVSARGVLRAGRAPPLSLLG
jgi:hypothetical protein